jgi:hypothetical protein
MSVRRNCSDKMQASHESCLQAASPLEAGEHTHKGSYTHIYRFIYRHKKTFAAQSKMRFSVGAGTPPAETAQGRTLFADNLCVLCARAHTLFQHICIYMCACARVCVRVSGAQTAARLESIRLGLLRIFQRRLMRSDRCCSRRSCVSS